MVALLRRAAVAQQALGAIAGGGMPGMGGGGMGGAGGMNPMQALAGGMPGGRPFKHDGRAKGGKAEDKPIKALPPPKSREDKRREIDEAQAQGFTGMKRGGRATHAGRTMHPDRAGEPTQTGDLKHRKPTHPHGVTTGRGTSTLKHWQEYAHKNAPGGSASGSDKPLPLPIEGRARGGKITAGAETGEGRLQIGRATMARKVKARLEGGRVGRAEGGRNWIAGAGSAAVAGGLSASGVVR